MTLDAESWWVGGGPERRILTPPPPRWGGRVARNEDWRGGVYINKILYYWRKQRPNYKMFILKFCSFPYAKGLQWTWVPITIRLDHMKLPIVWVKKKNKKTKPTKYWWVHVVQPHVKWASGWDLFRQHDRRPWSPVCGRYRCLHDKPSCVKILETVSSGSWAAVALPSSSFQPVARALITSP